MEQVQYISDENKNVTTAYLLKSETMKRRLLEAKNRKEGIPFDEACKKLGV